MRRSDTRSPAMECSASRASRPATPPPAMTTSMGQHHRAPPSNGARWAATPRRRCAAAISVLIADAGAASADYVRVMTTTAALPLAAIEAHSVMSPGLVTCLPGAALTEVATLMAVHQVHAVVMD